MKLIKIITYTTLCILCLLVSCQKTEKKEANVFNSEKKKDENIYIQSNSIADDLIDMESAKKIAVSKEKEMFLFFLDKPLTDFFKDAGYLHRLKEVKNTWRVYNDSNYIIIIGSVAKSDTDVYVFSTVFSDDGDGQFNLVFQKIGKDILFGEYPKKLIPYK